MTDIPPGTITRENWNARIWPVEVHAFFLSKLLTGSPFANALTAAPTSSGVMVWPLVSPEGAAWLREAQQFPSANLNDEVYEVAVCKLGTIISVSNESIDDTAYPVSQNIGRAIADSCGPIVDNAFLYGEGGLAPKGVLGAAPASEEAPDFRAAAITAWGELANAGAPPETIVVCANPVTVASEWARTDDNGQPLHNDGPVGELTLGPGIRCLPVPKLLPADVLAVDVSSVFRVIRDDFRVDSADGFTTDTQMLRVRGRLAVAAPTPDKSLRKVTIAAP